MIADDKLSFQGCKAFGMQSLKWMFVVLFMLQAVPLAHAFDSSDPFNNLSEVSHSPAKNMLRDVANACQLDANLPIPLTLLDAVEHALCNNPQTTRAWAQVKAQAATKGINQAAYLPTLEVRSSINNSHRENTFVNNPAYSTLLNAWDSDISINLNWVLYDFGLRAANLEAARRLLNAANSSQDDTLQTIFFNAAQAFYEAQAAEALLKANSEAEQAAQKSFMAAEEKYTVGVGTLADKLQAQTSHAQATSKRIQSEGDLSYALGNLAMTMGLPPNIPIQLASIADDIAQDPQFLQAVDKLIERASQEHPKILAAQAQLQAAQAKIDATRAQGLPTVAFIANEDYFTTSASAINNQGSSEQLQDSRRFGLQLSVPLFEGFSRQYKIRESSAQAEIKAAELANTEQQVALEVWKSYQTLRTETENLKASKVLNLSASQSYDVAQGRYRSGVGNILELLKAQTDLAGANQQKLLAVTRWQTAKIRLAMSLGQLGLNSLVIQARS